MKLNFMKSMVVILLSGLVLCGVGIGITAAEISTFKFEDKSLQNTITDTVKLYFPENGKPLYYNDFKDYSMNVGKFSITEDSTLPVGTFEIDFTHSNRYSEFNTSITNEFYLYDEGNMYISEHNISYLKPVDVSYNSDEADAIKEFLSNLKERRFITENNDKYDINIRVNPADVNRLIKLNSSQITITYKDYLENYKKDYLVEEADNKEYLGEDESQN